MVDIESISRQKAILMMNSLVEDVLSQQRGLHDQQRQNNIVSNSLILLTKKVVDECEMRMEAEKVGDVNVSEYLQDFSSEHESKSFVYSTCSLYHSNLSHQCSKMFICV